MSAGSTFSEPRRLRLLAGAAALVLCALASPAFAQDLSTPNLPPEPPAPVDDGLGQDGYYLEADMLTQDDKSGVITAEGGVQIRHRGRTLRADKLIYDQTSGVVTAIGNVVLIEADGQTAFADEMVLDDQLRAGVAKGFSARLQGDIKIAADTAVKRSDTVAELNQAIYTPCELCADDPSKPPTWSIRAQKVVRDEENQVIIYQGAVIEIFGTPIFYAPVFWHADPSADRKSGFLPPRVVASQRRGLSYEQPYLWVIDPYSDVIVSPQLNTKVNPFVNLNYRRRFYSGQVNVRLGYTYEEDLDSNGGRVGDLTSRSYILADGAFDIDQNWRWGFALERASDDLIFEKYDIEDVARQRGLVASDNRRLTSQLFATRQDNRSWFSINAISVQGLRPVDIDRTFPTVAPMLEARWEPANPILGGRLRLRGSAVALTREQSQFVAAQPGIDSRRATAVADWRSNYTYASGLRLSPFAQIRADVYSVSDLPGGDEDSFTRAYGVAGVDVAYPLFRRDGDRTIVMEPLLQIAVAPESELAPAPNEDSLVLEFDEANLMRPNRSPGYDLIGGGVQFNAAWRTTFTWDDGREFSFLVGRSFRTEDDPVMPARSGLRPAASDWIVAADASWGAGINGFARARFDADTGDLRRMEFGADVITERGSGFVRYLRDDRDILGGQREDIDFAGDVFISGNWGITFAGVRDIENDVWRRQEFGVFYRDDCLDAAVVYVHEETFNRTLGPSDSVVLRLTLATLGDKGYGR